MDISRLNIELRNLCRTVSKSGENKLPSLGITWKIYLILYGPGMKISGLFLSIKKRGNHGI